MATIFDSDILTEINEDTILLSLPGDKLLSSNSNDIVPAVSDTLKGGEGNDTINVDSDRIVIQDKSNLLLVADPIIDLPSLPVNNPAPPAPPAPPATLDDAIGKNGIDSRGLKGANGKDLTGEGIKIGQVELGRPPKKDHGSLLVVLIT